MTGPLKNDQGQVSGAKAVLLLACALAVLWLVRDLVADRELSETHAALMGALLVIGLLNRVSARGHFKISLGRDGAALEGGSRGHPGQD